MVGPRVRVQAIRLVGVGASAIQGLVEVQINGELLLNDTRVQQLWDAAFPP